VSEYSKKVRSALDAAVTAIGGSPREGQIEMAEAVANALSDRHHLLVQAGTGTGKSLAYLVPARLLSTSTCPWQKSIGSNCHLGIAAAISGARSAKDKGSLR